MKYPAPFDDPIVQNLIASAIWAVGILVSVYFIGRIRSMVPLRIRSPLFKWVIAFLVGLSPLLISKLFGFPAIEFAVFVSFVILFLLGWILIKPYADAGLNSVSQKTVDGIGFRASLKLVHHRLDFLGVGAEKLTREEEFKAAVSRISRGSAPVRLLLSPPNNPLLEQVANRAGINPSAYQKRVRESLARLAHLKHDLGYNVEVKFYPVEAERDYQQFRLMFIDEKVCLLSYTVWDNTDGSNNPQFVLTAGGRDRSRRLYSAFHEYFDKLWNDPKSEAVDLRLYRETT